MQNVAMMVSEYKVSRPVKTVGTKIQDICQILHFLNVHHRVIVNLRIIDGTVGIVC